MSETEASGPRPRVILADDHTLLLEALSRLLSQEFEIVGTASDGLALVEVATERKPDIVIADIAMPGLDGIAAGERLRAALPDTKLVYLTMHTDPALAAQAFRMGALGYVLKSAAASELNQAVAEARAGRRYLSPAVNGGDVERLLKDVDEPQTGRGLSPRETEVVRLLARGLSMKQVARELDITPRTVAFHKYNVMQQLNLKSNADLYQYAVSRGLIEPK